jgi:hypothetical protein
LALIGFLVLVYLVTTDKLSGYWKIPVTHFVRTISALFFVFFAVLVVAILFNAADDNGWYSHDRIVTVLLNPTWMPGEFQTCALEKAGKDSILDCEIDGKSSAHQMAVQFRGSPNSSPTDRRSMWFCQRKTESTACKAASLAKTSR